MKGFVRGKCLHGACAQILHDVHDKKKVDASGAEHGVDDHATANFILMIPQ